jgi:glutathione S-transferase
MNMYSLFITNKNYSSWSLRPWVLLKELAIPFTEKLCPISDSEIQKDFLTFSPTGLVPCLHHNQLVVWDSLAIAEYLAEQHPTIWPQDIQARAWARSAAAEMHSGFSALRQACSMSCGVRIRLHTIRPNLQRNLNRLDQLWAEGLTRFGGPFLAGEKFTAVDAFFAPIAFRARTFDLPLNSISKDYLARLLALPSMQAWDEAALKESWREPTHEQEVLAAGTLLADYRHSGAT